MELVRVGKGRGMTMKEDSDVRRMGGEMLEQ